MKFYTVYVDRSGTIEIKLGHSNDGVDREALLHRPSDFAEFPMPTGKDEGQFLREKFAAGVNPKTSVVVTIGTGQKAKAWRVRA